MSSKHKGTLFVRIKKRAAVRAIFDERIGKVEKRHYQRNLRELDISPDAHLFVVLMRPYRRVVVAQIDSQDAWGDFQRFYPVTWAKGHEIKFVVLSSSQYRQLMMLIDPAPGQRRFADSQWHRY